MKHLTGQIINRWIAAGLAALLGHVSPTIAGEWAAESAEASPPPKTLLMHYMPWYRAPNMRGSWGPHWTGWSNQHNPNNLINGLPDIWSHYHPLVGPYDSTDPDVLECQLLQMKLAGVDGVIADWYGISGTYDYPEIQVATLALVEATERYGLTFSVCFEDRTLESQVNTGALPAGNVTSYLTQTFQWVQNNWFSRSHYQRIDGEPLVLNFGPIYVTNPSAWATAFAALADPPTFFALHHLWEGIGADGGYTWMHADIWNGSPSEALIKARLNAVHTNTSSDPARVIPSAVPGFDDIYDQGYPDIPHSNGDTMRQTLEVAMDGPWQTIQLATWNDYGEGTMIEPTHEFGYTFLEKIQKERIDEQGAAFPFGPDDLRLPGRLLAQRRAGGRDACLLDEISAALVAGDTASADAKLDLLESDPGATCEGVCPVDLNGDSVVDNGDIGAFVDLFLSVSPAADFNGDGVLDNGDIGAFINAFLAGC